MTRVCKIMKWLVLCVVAAMIGQSQFARDNSTTACRHDAIVVEHAGSLQRYERVGKKWQAVGDAIPVSVGKHGLAWGWVCIAFRRTTREKREGDGCAPAGIFGSVRLLVMPRSLRQDCKLSYRAHTDRDYFVDEPAANEYNRWVTIPLPKPNHPGKFWKSFERMKRRDRRYEFGIVVQQNDQPIVKGGGSAIFLHVWRSAGVATVGCTAMAREDLLTAAMARPESETAAGAGARARNQKSLALQL